MTSSAARPVVGLVVPPAHGEVPSDAVELYPNDVGFVASGLGLQAMRPDDYGRALQRLEGAVHSLIERGADAVSLMGTSLSFYRGVAGHAELCERLARAAGGLPTSTMAQAVVRSLRHVGAMRVAVGSAYTRPVADTLIDFLTELGFEVVARRELDLTDIDRLAQVEPAALTSFGDRILADAPGADALLLSCGGLRTLPVIPALERRWQRPVISSSQAGFWDAVRLIRPDLAARHRGLLFAPRRFGTDDATPRT